MECFFVIGVVCSLVLMDLVISKLFDHNETLEQKVDSVTEVESVDVHDLILEDNGILEYTAVDFAKALLV